MTVPVSLEKSVPSRKRKAHENVENKLSSPKRKNLSKKNIDVPKESGTKEKSKHISKQDLSKQKVSKSTSSRSDLKSKKANGDSDLPTKKKVAKDSGKGKKVEKIHKVDDSTARKETLFRKERKNNYSTIQKLKSLWEELREKNVSNDDKKSICDKALKLVKGKVKEFVFAHDASRIMQCLFGSGSDEVKEALFDELKSHIVHLASSLYGKFILIKIIRHGNRQQRTYIFEAFLGHVRRLIRHTHAAEVIEHVYSDFCNAEQKCRMLEDFYGVSFQLFKNNSAQTLHQVLECNPEKRAMILRGIKNSLSGVVNKTSLQYSLAHRLFVDYLSEVDEAERKEIIQMLREVVVNVFHTPQGAKLCAFCLWHGDAKDRKVILKSFKTHVVKIAKEETAHLVLLAAFDCVDDTKLLNKLIIEELFRGAHDLASDVNGRRVMLYLLSPRDKCFFHSAMLRWLEEGDGNPNSKKDMMLRQVELREITLPVMSDFVTRNIKEIATDPAQLIVLQTFLKVAKSDVEKPMRALAHLAAKPFLPQVEATKKRKRQSKSTVEKFLDLKEDNGPHLVESTAGHLTLKHLIKNDESRVKAGYKVFFSEILLEEVSCEEISKWSHCNRGCFVLDAFFSCGVASAIEKVRDILDAAEAKNFLSSSDNAGAKALLKSLENNEI